MIPQMQHSRIKEHFMKKIVSLLLLGIAALAAQVNAVVSVLPEKTFVEAIGGDKVQVTVMVLPGNSPHTYEPKPSQMKAIARADIYFAIGVEFEEVWLPRFADQNARMTIVDLSEGVTKMPMTIPHHHVEAAHARADQAKGHHHDGLDPHIWTSPANVAIIAADIYRALAARDQANRDYYKQNYETFLKRVKQTDATIRKILARTPKGTKFMVFHPAWGYFAHTYNLTQIAIEASGKTPKPKQVIRLIKEAKEEQVTAVLTAPEFSQKVARQIAREVGVPVVTISPLDPHWSQNLIGLAKAIAHVHPVH